MPEQFRRQQALRKDLSRAKAFQILCAAAFCACAGCSSANPKPEEKAPPATVKWQGPLRGALEEWTELAGTTTPLPNRVARVSAPVEGRVVSVLGDSGGKPVVEGQMVEKGAILAQLDSTLIQANLAKTDAMQAVLREEEQQAKYAVELAQSEVDRLGKLKAEEEKRPAGDRTQLVSPVDILKADFAVKDARSKLKSAEGRLVAGAKELDALRAQLKLHTLTAPITGRIGRILVARGQTLAVGAPVADIVDLDAEIDVLCFAPPSMVGRLELGQTAQSGGFDANPSAAEAQGQVAFIADLAEPETGNFALKVRFSNKEAHLRANRVLRIRIMTKPKRECLSLPESAVDEDEELPTVVVVTDIKTEKNDEGKEETIGIARRLQATLGVRDRTRHQVEIVRLEDPEKDAAKKWKGEIKDAMFIVEGGQGLQTGDLVKREAEGE